MSNKLPDDVNAALDYLRRYDDYVVSCQGVVLAVHINVQAERIAQLDADLEDIRHSEAMVRKESSDRAERIAEIEADGIRETARSEHAVQRAEAAEAELARVNKWARGRCSACENGGKWNADGTDACGDCPGEDDPKNWTPAWGETLTKADIPVYQEAALAGRKEG